MRTNVTVGSFVPGNETSTMWSFRSRERKCIGTKRPGTICRVGSIVIHCVSRHSNTRQS